jgi:hypothetical protein
MISQRLVACYDNCRARCVHTRAMSIQGSVTFTITFRSHLLSIIASVLWPDFAAPWP